MQAPLAERLRPQSLADYVGQSHLVGKKGSLAQIIERGKLPSLLLWGPPGTGKTTLVTLIAKAHERPFYNLSAIHSGVKEVREVIDKATNTIFLIISLFPSYINMVLILSYYSSFLEKSFAPRSIIEKVLKSH